MKENSVADLARGWSGGQFHTVYLFGGPDTLSKDEAVGRLKKAFLGASPTEGADVFDAADHSVGAVLSAIRTLPFFGGRRMVMVRRIDEWPVSEINRLSDGLENLPSSNCLVLLSDEKLDARSVLVQSVRSAGAAVAFWPPFENQLPGWVRSRVEAAGKSIDLRAAQTLLDRVGPSLPDLAQEIDKLILFVGERGEIRHSDVESLGGERALLRFMEWERALWRRDGPAALSILEVLRGQGEPSEKLLPQLIRAVQKLALGKALFAEKTTPKKLIFDRLWIRMFDAQADFERALPLWPWSDILRAYDALVQTDISLKTGRGDPSADLTRLVVRMTEKESHVG